MTNQYFPQIKQYNIVFTTLYEEYNLEIKQ